MSATTVAPTGGSRLTPRPRSRARRIKNAIATVLISLAFVVALVPLVFIVAYVVQRGSELFGWDFLTQPPPFSERLPGGGMGPAVAGTLLITGAASLMAIPLGVLGGIYLNEYGAKNAVTSRARIVNTNTMRMSVKAAAHARSCATVNSDRAFEKISSDRVALMPLNKLQLL